MYDDPPDPPEPPPCPFCEAEIGSGNDCEHCQLVQEHGKLESAHRSLQHNVRMAARTLADTPIFVDGDRALGVSDRFTAAMTLVLKHGGLPVDDDRFRLAFAAVVPEYGWMFSSRHDPSDAEVAAAFFAACDGHAAARPEAVLPEGVLDRKPASVKDGLWFLSAPDGTHFVATDAEKLSGQFPWTGGRGGWDSTLREDINAWFDSLEGTMRFWLKVYRDYRQPPADLVMGNSATYVVGDQAYTAHVGKFTPRPYGGLGFGGAGYHVRLADGREFFTNNNWSRGTVPPKLRELLAPNAEFIKPEPLVVADSEGGEL